MDFSALRICEIALLWENNNDIDTIAVKIKTRFTDILKLHLFCGWLNDLCTVNWQYNCKYIARVKVKSIHLYLIYVSQSCLLSAVPKVIRQTN